MNHLESCDDVGYHWIWYINSREFNIVNVMVNQMQTRRCSIGQAKTMSKSSKLNVHLTKDRISQNHFGIFGYHRATYDHSVDLSISKASKATLARPPKYTRRELIRKTIKNAFADFYRWV